MNIESTHMVQLPVFTDDLFSLMFANVRDGCIPIASLQVALGYNMPELVSFKDVGDNMRVFYIEIYANDIDYDEEEIGHRLTLNRIIWDINKIYGFALYADDSISYRYNESLFICCVAVAEIDDDGNYVSANTKQQQQFLAKVKRLFQQKPVSFYFEKVKSSRKR